MLLANPSPYIYHPHLQTASPPSFRSVKRTIWPVRFGPRHVTPIKANVHTSVRTGYSAGAEAAPPAPREQHPMPGRSGRPTGCIRGRRGTAIVLPGRATFDRLIGRARSRRLRMNDGEVRSCPSPHSRLIFSLQLNTSRRMTVPVNDMTPQHRHTSGLKCQPADDSSRLEYS